MANINIPVSDQLHRRVRIAAAEDERRMTEIVREALEWWLDDRATGRERCTHENPLASRSAEVRCVLPAGHHTDHRFGGEQQ